MATVGGLQPVTPLSFGRFSPAHQGPSAYSSCSPSLLYKKVYPAPHRRGTLFLVTSLAPALPGLLNKLIGRIIPDFHKSVKWV
jgi:hypothetical protein